MGNMRFFDDLIESKLLNLHTAYLAKVLSTSGNTAKILPLGMTKAYGETAISQSPLSNVPILNSARYKITARQTTYVNDVSENISKENISYVSDVDFAGQSATGETSNVVTDVTVTDTKDTQFFAVLTPLAAGDIVLCVCCERNITDAKSGANSVPPIGRHNMSDSIIVGIL